MLLAALAACAIATIASGLTPGGNLLDSSRVLAATHRTQHDSPQRMKELAEARATVATNKEKVRVNPNDAQAHKALGDAYLILEEYENAFASFKEVLRVIPNDAEAYRGIGEAYERVWQYAKARDFYKEAVRLNPTYARALGNLGNMQVRLFQYEEAIGALKEGIRLKQSSKVDYSDYYNLGEAYQYTGKYQDAVNAYQQALKLGPQYESIHTSIAEAYNGLKQYQDAIASAGLTLKQSPYDAKANRVLGDSYAAMEKYEKAVEYYKESIRVSANRYQVEALLGLGLSYNTMGRHDEAVAQFDKGIAYASTPKQFASEEDVKPWLLSAHYFAMAQANLSLGRGEAAAAAAQKYIELRSWNGANAPYAALLLYFGKRKAGKTDEALKFIHEASAHMDAKAWPFPVFQYLRGELKGADLIALATDRDKMTEARAYMGMYLALAGRPDDARPHLGWVVQNGNRSFIEYTLAQSELRQLATGHSRGPLAPGNPPLTREVSDALAEFVAFIISETMGTALVADQPFKDSWAQMLAANYRSRSAAEQERLSHVPEVWASLRGSWPQKGEEERAKLRDEWREILKQAMTASRTKEQVEAEKSLQALQALIQLGQQRQLQPNELNAAAGHMDVVATGLLQLGDEQSVEAAAQLTKMAQTYRASARQASPAQATANQPQSQTDTQGAVRMIQKMNNNHFATMSMIQFMSRRF
jgi:tetratricopeptide (TPR) repeat protein